MAPCPNPSGDPSGNWVYQHLDIFIGIHLSVCLGFCFCMCYGKYRALPIPRRKRLVHCISFGCIDIYPQLKITQSMPTAVHPVVPQSQNVTAVVLPNKPNYQKWCPASDLPNSVNYHNEETDARGEDCVVCLGPQRPRGRLVPCGHASFCFDCSSRVSQGQDPRCPLCRTPIQQVNQERDN